MERIGINQNEDTTANSDPLSGESGTFRLGLGVQHKLRTRQKVFRENYSLLVIMQIIEILFTIV